MSQERIWVLDEPAEQRQQRTNTTYEEFWQVDNPLLLAKKVLDQKDARKFFGFEALYKNFYSKTNESIKVNFSLKDQIQKQLKKEASKKTLLGIIAEKDTKMIRQKKMKKLIRHKLSENTPISVDESLEIWKQCSGSVEQMRQNQGYYKRLLKEKYEDYYIHQIQQDIKRSTTLINNPEQLEQMKRIFIAYARRNAYIGYCQGLNYIVAKFLKFGLPEEESFWLLTSLLEEILPLDYFIGIMVGVVCDQRIMEALLKRKSEKLYKKLQSFEVNVLNILLTTWIVCLFSQALDESLLLVAWNMLFSKGSIVIFKVCLVLLEYCSSEISKSKGLEVVKEVEEKIKKWKDVKQFKKKLKEIYINERGIRFMRELYRQVCVIQLEQRQALKLKKQEGRQIRQDQQTKIQCDQSLPICLQYMEAINGRSSNQLPPEFFIFKTERSFNFDFSYFSVSREQDKRNVGLDDEDIMQTMQEHTCEKKIIQEVKEEEEQEEEKENPVSIQFKDKQKAQILNGNEEDKDQNISKQQDNLIYQQEQQKQQNEEGLDTLKKKIPIQQQKEKEEENNNQNLSSNKKVFNNSNANELLTSQQGDDAINNQDSCQNSENSQKKDGFQNTEKNNNGYQIQLEKDDQSKNDNRSAIDNQEHQNKKLMEIIEEQKYETHSYQGYFTDEDSGNEEGTQILSIVNQRSKSNLIGIFNNSPKNQTKQIHSNFDFRHSCILHSKESRRDSMTSKMNEGEDEKNESNNSHINSNTNKAVKQGDRFISERLPQNQKNKNMIPPDKNIEGLDDSHSFQFFTKITKARQDYNFLVAKKQIDFDQNFNFKQMGNKAVDPQFEIHSD